MKKLVLMSLIVLGAAPAFAKVSSAAIVASQFNWRGLKLTAGPAVQGMTTYSHESGAAVGAFVSNQDLYTGTAQPATTQAPHTGSNGYLLNPYLAYGMQMGDIGLSFMAMYYNFSPSASTHNGMEYTVGATWMGAKLSLAYMPRSIQSIGTAANGTTYESSDMYLNLSYKAALEKDLAVFVAFGNTMYGTPANIGMSNYSDYKVALQHAAGDNTVFELGYTDTLGLKYLPNAPTNDTGALDYQFTAQTYVSVTKAF